MYCVKCGTLIPEGDKICPSCQNPVGTIPNAIVAPSDDERKKANRLCIASLICSYVIPSLNYGLSQIIDKDSSGNFGYFLYTILSLSSLAGIVLMIVARVKYPNSKFAKALMWMYICLYVGSLIFAVIFIISCVGALKNSSCG